MKICNKCKKEKPFSDFWKCRGTKDGLQYRCIECLKERWVDAFTNSKDARAKRTEQSKLRWDKDIQSYLYYMARKRAGASGVEFTIRPSDIDVVDVCPVMQVEMTRHRGQFQNNSYSLDRVDSTRGYVPGNVRVISWYANHMKSNMSLGQIERLLQYMKGEL